MISRVLMIVTSNSRLGETGKPTGLWAEELAVPYYRLVDAGVAVDIASPTGGKTPIDPGSIKAPGSNGPTLERFLADTALQRQLAATPRVRTLDTVRYDGIFFPGGHGTMWDLPLDQGVTHAVEAAFANGKIIASVCHGAAGLVAAHRPDGLPVVYGRRITAFTDAEEAAVGLDDVVPFRLESRLRALGARFEAAANWQPFVLRDGMFISGQNPQSSELVADGVLAALGIQEAQRDA
jgi:putative intracellular protease/amidase